jgi:4-amino-4-deoxy-L-arabinose transferase-like glycosyltransferase
LDYRLLPSKPTLIFLLLAGIGAGRIVATYRSVAQTSDETPNIACGMQYLDLGRYDYGAFHPPLARLAIALGPYLYGARAQKLPDRWPEGNAVLNSAPRYGKALTFARLGILPFFLLACTIVWLWGRKLLGEWGALAPVFVFTNLPPVLAHAGLATMDMAIGAGICTALFTYILWLEEGTLRRAILFGAGLALAILCKFSSVLLLPVCIAAIAWLHPRVRQKRNWAWIPVAFVLIWGAYRFSFGPMTEHVSRDAAAQGGIFAKIPTPLLHALETLPVPAPQLLDGLWQVHNHVDAGHTAYLLGRHSFHGWWYFFPIALAVKTPLAVLLLAALGAIAIFRAPSPEKRRALWMPAILTAVILLINLPTSLNIGVRYMLPLYPLLALTAGIGAVWLWRQYRRAAIILLVWTAISAATAHPEYIAYFNEFGGAHPERILVDSDLDWGQDMTRLAAELKRRRVTYLHMSCLYTGDDTRLGLPAWDGLEPYQPVTGWVAVSQTMLKNYGWMVAQQRGRRDLAFDWLEQYLPTARVGKSILLYYIPERAGAARSAE